MRIEQADDGIFAIGDCERALGSLGTRVSSHAGTSILHPRSIACDLLLGKTEIAEAIFLFTVLAQFAEEAGGAALGRGGRVVQLMAEVRGEFAEGVEFFRLLLNAGDLADPIEQHGDAALAHGGDGGEHLGEQSVGNVERPDRTETEALTAIVLHTREGKLAGHRACTPDEQSDIASMTSAHLHLAAQNKVHIVRGVIVTEEDGAVGTDSLRAMSRKPCVLFFGQAIELSDGAESGDDLRDRRRLGWWSRHDGLVCLIERLRGKQTFVVAIQSGHLRGSFCLCVESYLFSTSPLLQEFRGS